MSDFPTPRLIISKCLGFAHCYYSGQMFEIKFLKKLGDYVEYIPICPEMAIGLPVPRQTLRLVEEEEGIRLRQPSTGADLTEKLEELADDFLEETGQVEGFICKEGSPSCGHKNVKLYPALEKVAPHNKTRGRFAKAVFAHHPNLPAESDGRLNNLRLREEFLTAVFALARFRKVEEAGRVADLIKFHSQHKYQLMALSQQLLTRMGRLTANQDDKGPRELIAEYGRLLKEALSISPSPGQQQNVLNHCFGYVSDQLSAREREYFLKTVERYRAGKVPLSVPLYLLYGWIIDQEVEYLIDQTYFQPFPEELVDLTDSGLSHKLD